MRHWQYLGKIPGCKQKHDVINKSYEESYDSSENITQGIKIQCNTFAAHMGITKKVPLR